MAIVQLAKPNVETLGDQEKKYAWAVISFVATVGGNLTLTGSAGEMSHHNVHNLMPIEQYLIILLSIPWNNVNCINMWSYFIEKYCHSLDSYKSGS